MQNRDEGEDLDVISIGEMAKRFPLHATILADGNVEFNMESLVGDFLLLAKMSGIQGEDFFSRLMVKWVKLRVESIGKRN